MSNALLEKARAILAHPKQGAPPKASTIEAGDNKGSMAEPLINAVEFQPAALNARPIYWETGDGRILGPAVPEFLARDGSSFWISTTFDGEIWWINADRLRSRQAFDSQTKPKPVELVKEPQ